MKKGLQPSSLQTIRTKENQIKHSGKTEHSILMKKAVQENAHRRFLCGVQTFPQMEKKDFTMDKHNESRIKK